MPRPPSVQPLDSEKIATANEHLNIKKRLNLDGMPVEEKIYALVNEIDRLETLRQLDKIHYAGGSLYHNQLEEMQGVINAQDAVIIGLENAVKALKSLKSSKSFSSSSNSTR